MRLLCGCNIFVFIFIQYVLSRIITTDIGRIQLMKELGRGSFGVVRRCHIKELNRHCAIKMELSNDGSTLPIEQKCYKALGKHPGIPRMLFYGNYKEGPETILVMELVGPSLMDIIENKELNSFSVKTMLMVGIQILYRTEYIHSKGIIFMDHKPENWVMGGTGLTSNLVHVLDFGLSTFYIVNGKHVRERPAVVGGSAAGTIRYLSLYAHRHKVVSRRDDIESIGYVIIYLLKGNFEWSSRSGDSLTGKSERVLKIKRQTSLKELIGNKYPKELYQFMTYARSLSFYQKPNYNYLRRLLRNALTNISEKDDSNFDWSEPRSVNEVPDDQDNYFWDIPLTGK